MVLPDGIYADDAIDSFNFEEIMNFFEISEQFMAHDDWEDGKTDGEMIDNERPSDQ